MSKAVIAGVWIWGHVQWTHLEPNLEIEQGRYDRLQAQRCLYL